MHFINYLLVQMEVRLQRETVDKLVGNSQIHPTLTDRIPFLWWETEYWSKKFRMLLIALLSGYGCTACWSWRLVYLNFPIASYEQKRNKKYPHHTNYQIDFCKRTSQNSLPIVTKSHLSLDINPPPFFFWFTQQKKERRKTFNRRCAGRGPWWT